MRTYEVLREIYNACANKWRIDTNFKDEWETEDIETLIASWHGGKMPKYEKEILSDGTIVYNIISDLPQRYSFSEINRY